MSPCRYTMYDTLKIYLLFECPHESDESSDDGFCILHSPRPDKDQEAFQNAFIAHRKEYGDVFTGFVFPANFSFQPAVFDLDANFNYAVFSGHADFQLAKFSRAADFYWAVFRERANFLGAMFGKRAVFYEAMFSGMADFTAANFSESASFTQAKFSENADFLGAWFSKFANFLGVRFSEKTVFSQATFSGEANFVDAKFSGEASFKDAKFSKEVDFSKATFSGEAHLNKVMFNNEAHFREATFNGEAVFKETQFTRNTIFSESTFRSGAKFISGQDDSGIRQTFCATGPNAENDFTDVDLEGPDLIVFRNSDLSRCRLLNTDVRKVGFAGVKWPKIGRRYGVYDEIAAGADYDNYLWLRSPLESLYITIVHWGFKSHSKKDVNPDDFPHLEQLYRRLKQNYEDQKAYERASDFHYGEKEMRRKNPKTRLSLRILLNLYRWMSGYGERYGRPLYWWVALLVASTFFYYWFELLDFNGVGKFTGIWHCLDVGLYSARVMTLLRPGIITPIAFWGNFIHTVQSILGPILIGLFALAIRQRLKR